MKKPLTYMKDAEALLNTLCAENNLVLISNMTNEWDRPVEAADKLLRKQFTMVEIVGEKLTTKRSLNDEELEFVLLNMKKVED